LILDLKIHSKGLLFDETGGKLFQYAKAEITELKGQSMNNWQETLLFPVADAEARKQFLIACLVALAGFIIPILPTLLLLGYGVKIMRQVLEERKSPSMPDWQESDWSVMLRDGLRVFGLQLILMLPLFILMGGGFIFMMTGSMGISLLAEERTSSFAPVAAVFLFIGMGMVMLFALLSLPYGIIVSPAVPHAVARNSFSAGLNAREWFPIFRKGLGNFVLGYVLVMVISFVFVFVLQFAMLTIILMCIIPFLMIPYSAYLTLISNTIYAQAYTAGRDALQLEAHASA
jgi:hypothetical protein